MASRPQSRSESLANYKLGKRLGAGAFGEVHLCTRKRDNLKLVVKSIAVVGVSRKEQELALNEVRLLSRVAHPRICRYHSSFVEDERLRIVMDYCEGGDLRRLIVQRNDRPLPEAEIWRYVSQAAQGVAHLHSLKVLHRDLKSSNFFLRHGDLLVGDLGCSRLLDATNGLASTMVGTPYYLSPELCNNESYDAKSDVWALGVVAYELLTCGKYPYTANNQAALIMRILRGGAFDPPPERYSAELRELVVNACLRHEPADRPTAAQLLELPAAKKHVPAAAPAAASAATSAAALAALPAGGAAAASAGAAKSVADGGTSGRGGGGFRFDAEGYARYEAAKGAAKPTAAAKPAGGLDVPNGGSSPSSHPGRRPSTAPPPPQMDVSSPGGGKAPESSEGDDHPGTRLFDDVPYSPPKRLAAACGEAAPHIHGGGAGVARARPSSRGIDGAAARPGAARIVASRPAQPAAAALVAENARLAVRVAAAATPGRVGYARAAEARAVAAVAIAANGPKAPMAAHPGGNRMRRMGPMNVQARADALHGVGASNARMGVHAARYERRLAEERRVLADERRRAAAAKERADVAASVMAQLAAHDARAALPGGGEDAAYDDDDDDDSMALPRHAACAGNGGGRPSVAKLREMMSQLEAEAEAEEEHASQLQAEAADRYDWEADNDDACDNGGLGGIQPYHGSSPGCSPYGALSYAPWLPMPSSEDADEDRGEDEGEERQYGAPDLQPDEELEETLLANGMGADLAASHGIYARPKPYGETCLGPEESFDREVPEVAEEEQISYDGYATTEGEDEEELEDHEGSPQPHRAQPASSTSSGTTGGGAGVGWRIC